MAQLPRPGKHGARLPARRAKAPGDGAPDNDIIPVSHSPLQLQSAPGKLP